MTEEEIQSFKPAGYCWKTNRDLSEVCTLVEGHSGPCGGAATHPNDCEVCKGFASNCNATPMECANDCHIHSKLGY
jgi:hypothetical protein